MNSCKYDHHRQTDPGVNLHLARFVLVGLVLVKSEIEVLTFAELIIKSFQHARFMKLYEYTHILTSADRVESITGDSPYSVTTVIEEVPMYLLVCDTLGYSSLENLLPMVYSGTVRFQPYLFNKTNRNISTIIKYVFFVECCPNPFCH